MRWYNGTKEKNGAQSTLQLKLPVPHLYLSNDAPSREEEKLIQQALDHAENLRKRYQEQMERRAIWELVDSKTMVPPPEIHYVDQILGKLKGVLSPLRRLPAELLQEIFICGSEGPDMRTYFPQFRWRRAKAGVKFPWTLSHVCRRWREVCIATPELWNYLPILHIDFRSDRSSRKRKQQQQKFTLMIQRSQGAQLHLFVDGVSYPKVTHPILDMLIKESDRWETAVVTVSGRTFKASFPPLKNRLRRLKCLRLTVFDPDTGTIPNSDAQTPPHNLWDTFSQIPSLTKAYLALQAPNNVAPAPTMTRDVCTFINFSSKLDTISLYIIHQQPWLTLPSTTLPCLRRLLLRGNVNAHSILLNSITLPSLEELIIDVPLHSESEAFLSATLSLIRRSAQTTTNTHTLKNLHLKSGVYSSSVTLIPILESLPNLRVLEFPLNKYTVSVVERLASSDPLVALAPQLEFCKFLAGSSSDHVLYSALNRLAKLRCNGSEGSMIFVRLQALIVECYDVNTMGKHQRTLQQITALQLSPGEAILRSVPMLGRLSGELSKVVFTSSGPATAYPSQPYLCTTFVVFALSRRAALNLLTELNTCRVNEVDVLDMYIPQTYGKLQTLDTWIESNISKVKWKNAPVVLKNLQAAIRDTLKDWSFALDEYSSKISWAAIGDSVLMFVPSDHPIRSSSRSIELAQVNQDGSNPSPLLELFLGSVCWDDPYRNGNPL